MPSHTTASIEKNRQYIKNLTNSGKKFAEDLRELKKQRKHLARNNISTSVIDKIILQKRKEVDLLSQTVVSLKGKIKAEVFLSEKQLQKQLVGSFTSIADKLTARKKFNKALEAELKELYKQQRVLANGDYATEHIIKVLDGLREEFAISLQVTNKLEKELAKKCKLLRSCKKN